jgi:lipid A 3-O-deacylase
MRKLAVLLVMTSTVAAAQSSAEPWDTGIWFAGGHSVPGGTAGVSLFDAGVRLGKVLTHDHGPGFMRGNFEYAIDLVPLYLVHQNSTVYGGGFNPINLKWNFTSSRRVTPYLELGGGTLFSTRDVPNGTNNVNFRTHGSLGIHLGGSTVEVRYEHISNAGLASPNPGINTVQVMVGWSGFYSCGWACRNKSSSTKP